MHVAFSKPVACSVPAQARHTSPVGLDQVTLGHQPIDIAGTVNKYSAEDAAEVGELYARWSIAAEDDLHQGAEQDPGTKSRGRGQFPIFRVGPAFKKSSAYNASEGSKEVIAWMSIAGRIGDLLKSRARNNGWHHTKEVEKFLGDDAVNMVKEMDFFDDNAGMVKKATEQYEKLLWIRRLQQIARLPDDILRIMEANAAARARKEEAKNKRNALRLAKEWIKKVCGGSAKQAHRHIKAHETHAEDLDSHTGGQMANSPLEALEFKSREWAARWDSGEDEKYMLTEELKDLRNEAKLLEYTGDEYDIGNVKAAIKVIKEDRALGVDIWSPKEWRQLSDERLEGLVTVLKEIDRKVSMPIQALTNIISLIPKPTGGDRPIGLTSMIYVLWSTLKGNAFKHWDEGRQRFWDDAVKGSSALKAALQRRLLDEVTILEGGVVVGLYWDIEKFFDSINIRKLIVLAREQGLDLKTLAIAMQAHLAPRVVKAGGCYGLPVGVSKSILAGCKFSIGFARSSTYWLLDEAHRGKALTMTRQFVDDIAQNTRGRNKRLVEEEFMEVAKNIFEGLKGEGFSVSGKSVLICSDRDMRVSIGKKLRDAGINVKIDSIAKDLGVDAAAGTRRTTKWQRSRIQKVKARAKRVSWMRKRTAKAKKLYLSNLWPAMAYGVSGYGVAPTTLRSMRTIAGRAALCAEGQCVTTAIALELGGWSDPALSTRAIVIADWAWLWKTAGGNRTRYRVTWHRLKGKLDNKNRWKMVKGPMAATIATLYDLGFDPLMPDKWITPHKVVWNYNDEYVQENTQFYKDLLLEYVNDQSWKKAAEHRNGAGLEKGADFTVIRKHLACLEKNDMCGKAALLRKAAVAGMWPRQRAHEANLVRQSTCPRCGKYPETEFHRIWQCEKNLEINDPIIAKTKDLEMRAAVLGDLSLALWTRGIVPAEETACERPDPSPPIVMVEGEGVFTPGTIYLDGSGGKFTDDPRRRRCGWAAVQLNFDIDQGPHCHLKAVPVGAEKAPTTSTQKDKNGQLTQAIFGQLPGAKQTVPRSELNAALQTLLAMSETPGDLIMVSDCKSVVDGFAGEGRGTKACGANGDLWHEIFKLMDQRKARGDCTTVKKVRAHAELWHVQAGLILWQDFVGNEYADAFAKKGASLHQVPQDRSDEIERIDRLAWRIQERIMVTNIAALEKKEENESEVLKVSFVGDKGEKRADSLEQLLKATDHTLVKHYDHAKHSWRWKCTRCLANKGSKTIKKWLSIERQCSGNVAGEGQIDTDAFVHLREWATAVIGEHENEQALLENAIDEVKRCGAHWPTFAQRAVDHIYSKVQTQEQLFVAESDPDVFGHLALGMDDDGGNAGASSSSAIEIQCSKHLEVETGKQRLSRLRAGLVAKGLGRQPSQSIKSSQLSMGNLKLHESHRAHHRRGIVWCWTCGAYGTEALKSLSKPCQGRPGRGAQAFLDRLRAGYTPRKGLDWPLNQGVGLPDGPVVQG